jgi:release factor glutamine methyltransferase
MTEHLEARGVDAPRVVAEMLLAHVLGCERLRIYMEPERPAAASELDALRALVRRAAQHEPVQYLAGRASFYGREILVDRSTLIPQPCTEDLVAAVIAWARAQPGGGDAPRRVADVGTGSGCIAISIALELPGASIVASDVVPAALDLARRNAERFAVADRIDFAGGPLLEPLLARVGAGGFDAIVSNPPYVPDSDWTGGLVQRSVKEWVPPAATRGGPDGLDCVRPLILGAGPLLAPGGLLAIEIASSQRDAVLAIASGAKDLTGAKVDKDYEGLWRVFTATKR